MPDNGVGPKYARSQVRMNARPEQRVYVCTPKFEGRGRINSKQEFTTAEGLFVYYLELEMDFIGYVYWKQDADGGTVICEEQPPTHEDRLYHVHASGVRTAPEIIEMIRRLNLEVELKPTDENIEAFDAQVDTLLDDMTVEEIAVAYEDYDKAYRQAMKARRWLDGTLTKKGKPIDLVATW